MNTTIAQTIVFFHKSITNKLFYQTIFFIFGVAILMVVLDYKLNHVPVINGIEAFVNGKSIGVALK